MTSLEERRIRDFRGFTLIELLTVIALLGLLAAILLPTLSAVRVAANRAKTRVQFGQWAMAIESFRQEYGYYPIFDRSNKVNGGATTEASGLHHFYDVLVGQRRDGTALPPESHAGPETTLPENQNTRRVAFIRFTESDLGAEGSIEANKRHLLRDAFGNTDIAVLVDRNLDGVIDDSDYPEKPSVSPPDRTISLSPSAVDFPSGGDGSGGIRAGVLFYSALPGATDASHLILSWK